MIFLWVGADGFFLSQSLLSALRLGAVVGSAEHSRHLHSCALWCSGFALAVNDVDGVPVLVGRRRRWDLVVDPMEIK